MEVIKAAEEAALAEAEAATYEAAAVAVAHGIITQEEVDALARYNESAYFVGIKNSLPLNNRLKVAQLLMICLLAKLFSQIEM